MSNLPRATKWVDSDSFREAKRSGKIVAGSGIVLGLKIAGHWKIVVFSNLNKSFITFTLTFVSVCHLKIVSIHPVDGSLPISS